MAPYTQETRQKFLTRLLQVEKLVHEIGPEEIKDVPLITMEELRFIRQIWLDEKHEFEDLLPGIYESVTGKPYEDGIISKNKYFGSAEATLLYDACQSLYPDETLIYEMQRSLLDIEAKAAAISNKRNVIQNFEQEIKKSFYRDEKEAATIAEERAKRLRECRKLSMKKTGRSEVSITCILQKWSYIILASIKDTMKCAYPTKLEIGMLLL